MVLTMLHRGHGKKPGLNLISTELQNTAVARLYDAALAAAVRFPSASAAPRIAATAR
jgi:hypothetical protein